MRIRSPVLCLSCRPQGGEKRFELLAAFSAHVEVFLDQRHGLGGVQARELHGYKAIQLLEALVAADLSPFAGLGYLLYYRYEDCFVYRRSFVLLVPVCTPRLIDVPGGPDLTSSKSAQHVLRREPLGLHPSS